MVGQRDRTGHRQTDLSRHTQARRRPDFATGEYERAVLLSSADSARQVDARALPGIGEAPQGQEMDGAELDCLPQARSGASQHMRPESSRQAVHGFEPHVELRVTLPGQGRPLLIQHAVELAHRLFGAAGKAEQHIFGLRQGRAQVRK